MFVNVSIRPEAAILAGWTPATPRPRSRRRSSSTTTPGMLTTSTPSSRSTLPGWSSRTTPPGSARKECDVGPHIAGIFERNPDLAFRGRRLYARDGLVVSEWTATATRSVRAARRVGRHRRLSVRERPDPAQGRLLVLAPSARSRPLVPESTPNARPRVHLATPVPADDRAGCSPHDFELVPTASGADGIVATPAVTVDAAYLDAAGPQLRIVANYAVGTDNVDLEACSPRAVSSSRTRRTSSPTPSAELTIGLILALLRRICRRRPVHPSARAMGFAPEFMLGESLEGKEFLVVGPGRIGKRVARARRGAHGARATFAGRGDDLHALLRDADVVSLHVRRYTRGDAPLDRRRLRSRP